MISWGKQVVLLVWAGSAETLVTVTEVVRVFLYMLHPPGGQLGLVHTALAELPV